MTKLGVLGLFLATLAVSACDPAVNPYMALGKDVSTSARATSTRDFRFSEPKSAVYAAILTVGSRDERNVISHDEVSGLVIVEYPFSMIKNVWGGSLRFQLTEQAGATMVQAQVYEKNREVIDRVLIPFVDEVKSSLQDNRRPAS
ncbi:MAG: hypothetical protein HQL42_18475 [Alphaproteobacteria bacterium]|nr:hypothetical protein [Alphaproteobacteria bacterium]